MNPESAKSTAELCSVLGEDPESLQLLIDLGDPEIDIDRKYRSPPDCNGVIEAGLIMKTKGGFQITNFGKEIREWILEISDCAICLEVTTALASVFPNWNEYEIFPDWRTLNSVEVIQGRPFEPDRSSSQLVEAISESEKTPKVANISDALENQIPTAVEPTFVSPPFDTEEEPLNRLTFAKTTSGGYLYIWAGKERPLEDSVLLAGTPAGEFTKWISGQFDEWQSK